MKVGIVTLNGYSNYGNRLQNYALQEVLKKLGFDVETIWMSSLKQNFKYNLIRFFPINNSYLKNKKLFDFTKKYINTNHIRKVTNRLVDEYDYFVCGSDQVWNYEFNSFNEKMFLSFSPKNKNISYAASFGVSKINDEYVEAFKNGLGNFKAISVREDDGKKIINKINDSIDVEVVLDPTLLLNLNDWNKIIKKPNFEIPEKYILLYMLGDLSYDNRKFIEKISSDNNWEIIDIMDRNSKYYSLSPEEFLFLEKHAKLICTDSFHSTIFSIIFETTFLVFDRNDSYSNMNSRLNSLLRNVNLESQFVTNIANIGDFYSINFSLANHLIEEKRKKSLNFLKHELCE